MLSLLPIHFITTRGREPLKATKRMTQLSSENILSVFAPETHFLTKATPTYAVDFVLCRTVSDVRT